MINLSRIVRQCNNVGGVRRVWIAAACDLAQDIAHSDFVLNNQNAAALPATFAQYEFERNTANYDETWEVSKLGISPRRMELRFFVNKSTASRLSQMNLLQRARGFVIVFEDNNRLLRMMGTKRHPARLESIKMGTGEQKGSAHGYTISFSAYPVPEPFFLPLPVEPPIEPLNDRNRETIHLRGNFRSRAVQFTDFMYELEVINIFDSLLNISYQFSNAALPDWTDTLSNPILTFAQMEEQALNASTPFWINFRAEGFTTGSDGFLLFNYRGPSTTAAMNLTFAGISQDNYVAFRERVSFGTPTLSAGISSINYNVISNPSQSFVDFPLTLAQLNAQIAALPVGTNYVVGVYVNYSGATVSGNVSIPITYL
jgi:hypothetical protein